MNSYLLYVCTTWFFIVKQFGFFILYRCVSVEFFSQIISNMVVALLLIHPISICCIWLVGCLLVQHINYVLNIDTLTYLVGLSLQTHVVRNNFLKPTELTCRQSLWNIICKSCFQSCQIITNYCNICFCIYYLNRICGMAWHQWNHRKIVTMFKRNNRVT